MKKNEKLIKVFQIFADIYIKYNETIKQKRNLKSEVMGYVNRKN